MNSSQRLEAPPTTMSSQKLTLSPVLTINLKPFKKTHYEKKTPALVTSCFRSFSAGLPEYFVARFQGLDYGNSGNEFYCAKGAWLALWWHVVGQWKKMLTSIISKRIYIESLIPNWNGEFFFFCVCVCLWFLSCLLLVDIPEYSTGCIFFSTFLLHNRVRFSLLFDVAMVFQVQMDTLVEFGQAKTIALVGESFD